jgi:hypothetical protein
MSKRSRPTARAGALAVLCLAALARPAAGAQAEQAAPPAQSAAAPATAPAEMTLETFLDRLMRAESDGNDLARNPRSSALGAFQFIAPTFLTVVRQHFAEKTAHMTTAQVLSLRTDRAFSREAARAYTKDNAHHLASRGLATSFPNLRLAYLVGPAGAVKVLRAEPGTKVGAVLSAAALTANPFMTRMTVADLIAKCARDLAVDARTTAGLAAEPGRKAGRAGPRIAVRCSLARPSCQRWLHLAEARQARKQVGAATR